MKTYNLEERRFELAHIIICTNGRFIFLKFFCCTKCPAEASAWLRTRCYRVYAMQAYTPSTPNRYAEIRLAMLQPSTFVRARLLSYLRLPYLKDYRNLSYTLRAELQWHAIRSSTSRVPRPECPSFARRAVRPAAFGTGLQQLVFRQRSSVGLGLGRPPAMVTAIAWQNLLCHCA